MGLLSNFTTESVNDVFVVSFNFREATIEQAGELNKLLSDAIEKGKHKLLIDMNEIKYMDSTFLGALIINFKKIISNNGKFLLVGLQDSVNLMVQQTNLNKIFKIYSSRTEALDNI